MEPARSSLHRLAPVALAALGIFGALLTIFAGLVALNHSVLPFSGWPRDGERLDAGRQVLPRAPVETGRLRTVPGGALAGASTGVHNILPVVVPELRTALTLALRIQRGATHAAPPGLVRAPAHPQPAAAPQPSPAPAPVVSAPSAPAVATPAATPVVVSGAPASRAPSTSTPSGPGNGNGNGHGRATAPGQLKKAAAQAAPAGPVAVPAAAPSAPADPSPGQDDGSDGNGNGNGHDNGHGPPPWAHGHH